MIKKDTDPPVNNKKGLQYRQGLKALPILSNMREGKGYALQLTKYQRKHRVTISMDTEIYVIKIT